MYTPQGFAYQPKAMDASVLAIITTTIKLELLTSETTPSLGPI